MFGGSGKARPDIPWVSDGLRDVMAALPWVLAMAGAVVVYAFVAAAAVDAAAAIAAPVLAASGLDAQARAATLELIIQAAGQVASAVVFLVWYRRLARSGFLVARQRPLGRNRRARVLRLAGIVGLAFGIQMVVSFMLTLLSALLPQLIEAYSSEMDADPASTFSALSLFVLSVGAPVFEEAMCRGVLLELALRAVCPRWRGPWQRGTRGRADLPPRDDPGPYSAWPRPRDVTPARFWIANALQASVFALLHFQIVQSSYAFIVGLAFGAIVWHTGRLRYSMLVHAGVNAMSYAVSAVWAALAPMGLAVTGVVFVAVAVGAARLFCEGTAPLAGLLPPADAIRYHGAMDGGRAELRRDS